MLYCIVLYKLFIAAHCLQSVADRCNTDTFSNNSQVCQIDAAMDNPVSSINVKVSPTIVDNNQWSYQAYPWTIHEWTPPLYLWMSQLPGPSTDCPWTDTLTTLPVQVSVGATVTVSIHRPSMDGHLASHLLSLLCLPIDYT